MGPPPIIPPGVNGPAIIPALAPPIIPGDIMLADMDMAGLMGLPKGLVPIPLRWGDEWLYIVPYNFCNNKKKKVV